MTANAQAKARILRLEIPTPLTLPDSPEQRLEASQEKRILYASAILRMIEGLCDPYVPETIGDIDPEEAHRRLLTIREAAELGRGLLDS